MFKAVVTQRVNAGTELEFGALARDPLGHPIDVYAHRNSLCEPDAGDDRVDCGNPLIVGLRIRIVDCA
jgi:hypothetical protein